MNNKGFTLMEILAVIAILAIAGIVVTVSLSSSLNDTNQERCDAFVKEIEDAACVYAGLQDAGVACYRPGCTLTLEFLVSDGLVEEQTDACTNTDMDLTQTVTVSWDSNGEKSCTYNGVRTYG